MNLLITGAWQQGARNIDEIRKKGHEVEYLQFEKDELPCHYEWIEGIIGNGIFLSHPIEKFINLKYLQLTSTGFDRVPMDYMKKHGIEIRNARDVYSAPMAECALSGVLALYKKQRFFFEKQKEHNWKKRRDLKELYGQKVCILGCGSVGTECAKRFNAFDCNVIGIDTQVSQHNYYMHIYNLDDLKNVLAESDIVVVTLPLTDQTWHMFNEELIDFMKDDAVLINIARGALIESEALIKALKEKLYGAVLDVFEEEPLEKNSELWDMENVIITPHNSFVGNNNDKRLSEVIMKNLENV